MDRIGEITKDCFNVLNQLRGLEAELRPQPESLHRRLRGLIDTVRGKAGQAGFAEQDVQDIAYALVALADEIALDKAGPLRDYWMSKLLQLHYFNENVAGENFFHRLETIRNDARRLEVLRVYYLCLMFGFMGRFRVRGGEVELAQITDGVQHTIGRFIKQQELETLAPHGERPEEARAGVRRNLPFLWVAIGTMVIAIGVYAGLRFTLDSDVNAVVQKIGELSGKKAP